MKKIIGLVLCLAVVLVGFGYVGMTGAEPMMVVPVDEAKKAPTDWGCPQFKFSSDNVTECLRCHVPPSGKLREEVPDEYREYPHQYMRVDGNTCFFKLTGQITSADSINLDRSFEYIARYPEVDSVVITISSSGGSLMAAWEFISIIESHKSKYEISTVVPGWAASAAFLIFCSGEERLAGEHAILMHHELWSFKMFALDDPSSAEEQSRVMRLLQDNIHNYLVKIGTVTKEDLDRLVRGDSDYWMTGANALDVGFATGLIGQ